MVFLQMIYIFELYENARVCGFFFYKNGWQISSELKPISRATLL